MHVSLSSRKTGEHSLFRHYGLSEDDVLETKRLDGILKLFEFNSCGSKRWERSTPTGAASLCALGSKYFVRRIGFSSYLYSKRRWQIGKSVCYTHGSVAHIALYLPEISRFFKMKTRPKSPILTFSATITSVVTLIFTKILQILLINQFFPHELPTTNRTSCF